VGKRWVLREERKVVRHVEDRIDKGRSFQIVGAAN
jgi:hypothetical protein